MPTRPSRLILALALLGPTAALATTPAPGYQQPSAAIRAVLDAAPLASHLLAPDQRSLALVTQRRHRTIQELARPSERLAGLRIDAAANSPQQLPQIESLRLLALDEAGQPIGPERVVALPAGGDFHQLRWSPDGRHFLLNRRTEQAVELWVGEVASGRLLQIPRLRLNTVLEDEIVWLGADEILVLAVPERHGPAPRFDAPNGPVIQESMGRNSPEYTLQDLLENPQDEALFAHLASSVLRHVTLSSGASRELGEPGLYSRLSAAGTQGLLLTERLLQPFSYRVRAADFARVVELRDAQGRLQRELGRIALKENVPFGGVVSGARQFWASPAADAAIYWVEALDGGDPRRKAEHRDRLLRLDPPYRAADAREIYRSAARLTGLDFLEDGRQALIGQFDRDRLWTSRELLALDGAGTPLRLNERSSRDRYRDPGLPLQRLLANGRSAVRVDQGAIWLLGQGAGPAGDRPFLDRQSLADGSSQRRFQSDDAKYYERPLAPLGTAGERLLSLRESFSEPPQLLLRSGAGLAETRLLSAQADPAPPLRQIRRELVRFKRADGVELSFWLHLPPGYRAGERRPTLVWAYPLEYTDAGTAGQISGSDQRFTSLGGSSPVMLALDGYVVLMDATMPVVGDPKTVNDSFIAQITLNAQAIIDKAVELGVSERGRMVVGGHSYGAFMTANLLAHTQLFKAGIARSGAYNRTLTPFGFQSERRSLWEAQDSYLRLSPFLYADKIKAPLLLIHGADDNNPGTFPMQSQRLYQALAGTGGRVRFVSLPNESHGYAARESLGHTLHEMSEWMGRQVGRP
ncbi:S9 family peptidase [Roseateles sp. DAIF2]|uniref:alpha/beta hydrolase family protein n=1 Tax=Roseateles sp. DAIF2 TaxID=2714952 RepID=UPI0018A2FAD1|nr:prolyl oligopeptidase family serine peptidase [Roseateles sp. DAIF2]QPF71715.1 S9 family peptidase [Roseateles sp. DAIF2]